MGLRRRPRTDRPFGVGLVIALSVTIAIIGVPRGARSAEVEVQATTALQAYELAGPWGDVVLQRRRFLQTVGFSVYNLQGSHRTGPDYRIVLRMRLDSDFGVNAVLPSAQQGGETQYSSGSGARYIPGLQDNPLDLMVGYVEGRNLAGGLLGFRVGRQTTTDMFGFWSFDGGLLRVSTPLFFQLEVYGGFEQRGGLPVSSSRFEQQGVWRGNQDGFNAGAGAPTAMTYPSFVSAQPAPAVGFALETTTLRWLHGRFAYRRVYNTGPATTGQFPDAQGADTTRDLPMRISQDRLGFSARVSDDHLGNLHGGLTYDLYAQRLATSVVGVEAHLGKRVVVDVDADYFFPTFDGDSIWNWFTHDPTARGTGRIALRFSKQFDVAASGGPRVFWTEGDASPAASGVSRFGAGQCVAFSRTNPSSTLRCVPGEIFFDTTAVPLSAYAQDPNHRQGQATFDGFGALDARFRTASTDVSLHGLFEAGVRGSREGADLAAERRFVGGRYRLGSRASLYAWADPSRPDRDATSFAYVLMAGFKPLELADVRVEWEHDMNRLVGQRFRVVGLLNLFLLR